MFAQKRCIPTDEVWDPPMSASDVTLLRSRNSDVRLGTLVREYAMYGGLLAQGGIYHDIYLISSSNIRFRYLNMVVTYFTF